MSWFGIITRFDLRILEHRDSNSGATVRAMIDERFESAGGWTIKKSGGVDWTKGKVVNGTTLSIGVEIQMSIRSDALIIDVCHLRDSIIAGTIDVGVIVTNSDRMAVFMTDRVAHYSHAVLTVDRARAQDLPLVVIGLEHDGPGQALPKRPKSPAGQAKSGRKPTLKTPKK